jgi:hypothetical protein
MRIIRVRRGFTTNSSSANDYLSPPEAPAPAVQYIPVGPIVVAPAIAPDAAASGIPTDAGTGPAPAAASRAAPADAGIPAVAATEPDAGRPVASTGPTGGSILLLNVVILLVFLGGLVGLFGSSRIVRYVRQRLGKASGRGSDASERE